MKIENVIPPEIETAFYPGGISEHDVLSGGIVNTTLLVTDSAGARSVLQRLHPILDKSVTEDYAVVAQHLDNDGWEMATPLKTPRDEACLADKTNSLWRAYSYIESDAAGAPKVSLESSVAISGLLGALHHSLAKLDYDPKYVRPHFHDTPFFAQKLKSMLPGLPGDESKLAAEMIALSRRHAMDTDHTQLIHGDPKVNNALYRNGKPFTFIDFDTLMRASPLVDVGDMLRSVTGKLISRDANFSSAQLEPVIDAYYRAAKPHDTAPEFLQKALRAGQLITLELGMRYLIDAVEDNYFSWDPESFDSRTEHNLTRAQTQWRTYAALA